MPAHYASESASDRNTRERLEGVLAQEVAQAEGGQSDAVQANRTSALNYYFGKPRGDEVTDRSQVISMDVADMTNSTLAMLVPMLATDAVVEFEPLGEEDEAQAKSESDVVNALIIEDNNGFIEIQEAIKDALLLKNGCMKVSMVEREKVEKLDFKGASDEEVALWVMDLEANQIAERDGDVMTLVTTRREFWVGAVPIENIMYQNGYVGRFQDIRFFAERIRYTRSDLIQMGIDPKIVAELNQQSESKTGTSQARDQDSSENYESYSPDTQIIDCYESYLRIDLDGDGISERYKILSAGTDSVLSWEPFDMVPYALGSPFINPHRLTGESLYDHLKATQDVKTALRRQLIDNVTTINNGRYAYDPAQVSEADVLNPKPGGGIRARNPSQSIVPIMVPDVQSGILASLQYEDQARAERGGASLDLMGSEAQLVGETAHGIERQYGSREALASMLARNLSETMIKGIYLLTHEFLRRWSNMPFEVRINGAFQLVDPTQWPPRNRVNVKTGMSPGERGHLQQTLMTHIQLQTQAMSQGLNGVLASPETIYRTTMDWLRMAGVDNPERHAIDPQSESALQVVQQQQQTAQQQQQQMQQKEAQIQNLLMQLEQAKLSEDARQHDDEIAFKYHDSDQKVALEEAKITGQGVIDLERERISNGRAT